MTSTAVANVIAGCALSASEYDVDVLNEQQSLGIDLAVIAS